MSSYILFQVFGHRRSGFEFCFDKNVVVTTKLPSLFMFFLLFPWVGRKWTKDERSGQWPPAVARGEDYRHNKNRMAEGCGQEGWGVKVTGLGRGECE